MWKRRVLLASLLLGGACGGGGSGGSAVLFVDVAAETGLVFTVNSVETFDDVIGIRNVIFQRAMGNGAAVGDVDGDGDLDVYLLNGAGNPNRLFRNDLDRGRRGFTEVTPPLLADLGLSRVAHLVDLDNDGDLDLLLVNDDDGSDQAAPSRIFRNDGGGAWTDVTAGSGFRPVGYLHGGVAVADYDRDGLLDVYVTNWGAAGTGDPQFPGHNRLYRNLGGLRFEDVTDQAGLGRFAKDSFTAIFTDFDDDGWPDLHVAVDHTSDQFWFNRNGIFENATVETGVTHAGNDMGVACADFDDDGDLDMYSTNITDPTGLNGTGAFNVLYVNLFRETGQVEFVDEALGRGCENTYWGWGTEWIDVEHDGDLDLVAVNGFDEWVANFIGPQSPIHDTPPFLLMNDGTGRFTRKTGAGLDEPRDGRALIAFDYDRDGDLDLLVTNQEQPVQLFENRSTGAGNWLAAALAPDAKAIGARVWATFGGVTKRRDVIAGRSYLAGTPSEVHFGLGAAAAVATLTVEWADGTTETFPDLLANQTLRIVAGQGIQPP